MANKLKRYIKLYWHLTKLAMQLETEYRTSFLIEIVVELAFFVSTLVSFSVIFSNLTDIAGWTKYEVMALLGMNMVLSETILGVAFIFNLRELPGRIIRGELDLFLVKPVSSLFSASLWRPYFASVTGIFAGLLVTVYAISQGQIPVTLGTILSFSFLFACGLIIAYCLGVIVSALSFWFLNATPMPFIAQQFIFMAKNPYSIYTGIWRYVFLVLIPTAFMLSFPMQALYGAGVWWWLIAAPILAATFLWLTHKFWQYALTKYSSASS